MKAYLVPSFWFRCPSCKKSQAITTSFLTEESHKFFSIELYGSEKDGLVLQEDPNCPFLNEEGVPYLFRVPTKIECKFCQSTLEPELSIPCLEQ